MKSQKMTSIEQMGAMKKATTTRIQQNYYPHANEIIVNFLIE